MILFNMQGHSSGFIFVSFLKLANIVESVRILVENSCGNDERLQSVKFHTLNLSLNYNHTAKIKMVLLSLSSLHFR